MYCPECGNDAGDAKFCPECGSDLGGLKNALKGKTTSQAASGKSGGGQRPPKAPAAAPAKQDVRTGLSPAVIWGGFGAVAVVVIVVVVMLSGGFGGGTSGSGTPSADASAQPVQGVTKGSYRELVQKGNEFYDKADAAFQSGNMAQGQAYFQAAAMTYAAAWAKQKTDPALGTDFATSLFYGNRTDAALKQVNTVIAAFPAFQPAFFNLGNYLSHKAAFAEQQGDKAAAKDFTAQAVQAYTKAIALDPKSTVGQEADARLKALQK